MKISTVTLVLKAIIFSVFLATIGYSLESLAQPVPSNRHGERHMHRKKQFRRNLSPEQRKALKKRIHQLKMWKLTERLNLTEDQSTRFFPRYNKYQDEVFVNFEKMHQLMARLRELKESNSDSKKIDDTVNEILNTQAQNHEILQKHVKKFRDVLSASQVAELIVFERDFSRDLRGLLNRPRPPRP